MSRSTNTRPLRVKLAQDPNVRRERHDHRLHPCNLPSLTELTQDKGWHWGECSYDLIKRYRGLSYKCDCSWCERHGATPPRTLRSQERDLFSQVAGRAPDAALLDEIDDVATPRR